MRLDSITIEGFKSIRELVDFKIRPINVLVGANGSGKTNFITAFQLLNEMLERRLQVYTGRVGAENLLYYGSKVTELIRMELSFVPRQEGLFNGYGAIWIPTDDDTLIFARENY